jgi:LytS/YehU family sensor histidine kinase
LTVDADREAATQSVMVPPLILQPLVENAVRHGIAGRPEGGHITLSATIAGDRLVMRVTDDGPGRTTVVHDGIGLGSVRQRLAANYGDRATLTIDTNDGGCVATITLPATGSGLVGSAA